MSLTLYFFLYPAGHFGFVAVTFLVILPLTQVIVDLRTETGDGDGVAACAGVGVGEGRTTAFSCESFNLIVGCENVNPLIET